MQNIEELIERYKSIKIAENYLTKITKQLETHRNRLDYLVAAVDALADKLESPEPFILKRLFDQTLGSETEQHEAERQEYLLAALKYRDCVEAINILEFESKIVKDKVNEKQAVKAALNIAIQTEKLSSSEKYPNQYKRLVEVNIAINDCVSYKREIYEAILISLKVQATLDQMLSELRNAKQYDNWGEFYAEKQQSKVYQKAYMDRAHNFSHIASQQMKRLKDELQDIFEFKSDTKMIVYEELLSFQDVFHESMITDWIIENDVVSSYNSVKNIKNYILRIIGSLKMHQTKTEASMAVFENRKDMLIQTS